MDELVVPYLDKVRSRPVANDAIVDPAGSWPYAKNEMRIRPKDIDRPKESEALASDVESLLILPLRN